MKQEKIRIRAELRINPGLVLRICAFMIPVLSFWS